MSTEINEALFWEKVDKTGECWEWTANKNRKGYGRVNVKGKVWLAHRLSFMMANGHIKAGNCIIHSCDNPSCVNPSHLSEGTLADNNRDMFSKGRAAYQTGSYAYPTGSEHHARKNPERMAKGERNGMAKLSDFAVQVMRKVHELGLSQRLISKAFNVNNSTVNRIVTYKTRIS